MPITKEPVARRHRGYIRVRWEGREYSCGRWGDPLSWERFRRLKADLLASEGEGGALTVAGLVARYVDQKVNVWYRHPDKSPTKEAGSIKRILKRLLKDHASLAAVEFTPRRLKDFRQTLIDAGRCRESINQEIGRVVRMFKWGVEEELIAPEVWHKLAAVGTLQENRTDAPDAPEVQPVADAVIDATLPHLNEVVANIVRFQRLTGCRPDEACRVRPRDIDRAGGAGAGGIWVYSPTCPVTGKPRHKTAWRGHVRAIPIGPRLQAILSPLLACAADRPDEYLFQPAAATAAMLAAKREQRKSKRWASHVRHQAAKRAKTPKRRPGAVYSVNSYDQAVRRAAEAADLAAKQAAASAGQVVGEGRLIPHWTPNQIRHTFATEAERRFGLGAVAKMLGHKSPDVTRIYVAENLEITSKIAAEIG